MLNTFEEDMKVGKKEEVSVLPFLRTYFNDDDLKLVKSCKGMLERFHYMEPS